MRCTVSWLQSYATELLESWREQGLKRNPATFTGGQDPVSVIDGEELVLFSSSNYLGLASHPVVLSAARDALTTHGVGSGGSRLTTGTTVEHHLVEQAFAEFLGYPDAVFLASGFHANIAVIQTLAGPGTVVLSDARNHASIIDGCRLAKAQGARVRVYPHRDIGALERMLVEHRGERCLVVTDGLFSMDGTLAPLPELTAVCRAHGAALVVDDAHGTATLGRHGRGIVEHFGMEDCPPDVLVATASKALGAEGGAVAAAPEVTRLLRQKARPFVYSTAPSPAVCAGVTAAVGVVRGPDSPLAALHANIAELSARLGLGTWPSPIIPIAVGEETDAVEASVQLRRQGFFVPAIRWPTVARGAAMLRVTVMATHTPEHIDALSTALERLGLPRR